MRYVEVVHQNYHLQGFDTDGTHMYWSFTDSLVKTNMHGTVIAQTPSVSTAVTKTKRISTADLTALTASFGKDPKTGEDTMMIACGLEEDERFDHQMILQFSLSGVPRSHINL